MAAKRAASSGPTLAVGLAGVQPALAAWRQRRRHREAIPENLWRLIVPLAQSHGVSPAARERGQTIVWIPLKNPLFLRMSEDA
jgi:hypothetical protein